MPIPPPPPGFIPDAPGASPPTGLGRPIIRKGVEPAKPQSKVVKDNYLIDPNTGSATPIAGLPPEAGSSKTSYSPMTAQEVASLGLPPGSYQKSSEGRIERIGGDGKNNENPVIKQQQQAQALLTAAGVDLEKGIDPIADLIKGSTSGPLQKFGADLYSLTGDATDGMENIAKLQTLVSDMTLQLTGGGLGNQISNADREFIMQRVGNLADPSVPAPARLAAWEQVKARMGSQLGITPGQPQGEGGDKESDLTLSDLVAGRDKQGGGEPPAGPSFTPSTGETRSVIDPKKQQLGNKIAGLMSKGADRNTIMGFAVRADPSLRSDPRFRAWVDKALAHRKKHPGSKFNVDPSFYTTEVPLSEDEQRSNETAQSGIGSFFTHAGDAVTAGNLANIADKLGGDGESVRMGLEAQSELNPGASTGGEIAGGIVAALGGEAALARLGMAPGLLRSLAADSAYGGISGGTNSDSDNFLGKLADAGKSALTAGAGSLVGQGLLKVPGKALEGVSNPTVGYVNREIPGALTVGQMVSQSGRGGAFVKNIEDKLAGSGLDGGLINSRRLEGLQKMNSKAFDRALEPIGENVAGSYGEEAVAAAQEKVGAAFRKALAGKSAGLDREFIVQAEKAKMGIEKLPPRVAGEVNDSVDAVINNYFDESGQISGENLQAALEELRDIKHSYYANKDPLKKRIGVAIDGITDSIEGLFERQAPNAMPQYRAAKKAQQRLFTLQDAVLSGKNTGGVFTSAQLGTADKANTIRFGGKNKAAAGGGEFHEFQRNMQEVLPSKVPDSGTAGRLVPVAALMGVGAGTDYATGGTGVPLGLAGLLSLAYTRNGQGLLRAATRPGGAKAVAAGRKLQKGGRALGAAAGTQAALGSTRD